jgi:hypothetical protein
MTYDSERATLKSTVDNIADKPPKLPIRKKILIETPNDYVIPVSILVFSFTHYLFAFLEHLLILCNFCLFYVIRFTNTFRDSFESLYNFLKCVFIHFELLSDSLKDCYNYTNTQIPYVHTDICRYLIHKQI